MNNLENSEPLDGLSVEEMAEILVIQREAEKARSLLNNQHEREIQTKVSRLASFAQFGAYPKSLEIPQSKWWPWARKRMVCAWHLEKDSNLVITESGQIGRIKKTKLAVLPGGLMFILILGAGFLLNEWLSRQLFSAALQGASTSNWAVVGGVGLALATFVGAIVGGASWDIVLRRLNRIAGIEYMDLKDLDAEILPILQDAEAEIKLDLVEKRIDIQRARAIKGSASEVLALAPG